MWLLFDRNCRLCGDSIAHRHWAICEPCEWELPWLSPNGCFRCAFPLTANQDCPDCAQLDFAFEHVRAPWAYQFPIDSVITQFKHQNKGELGRWLAEGMARHLQQTHARADVIYSVPLAPNRERQRGFNQAALLARWVGKALSIPVSKHSLTRQAGRSSQHLTARERRKQNQGAFKWHGKTPDLSGQHIALVDDVLTTGATANQVARLLKEAGAERVEVWVVGRVL